MTQTGRKKSKGDQQTGTDTGEICCFSDVTEYFRGEITENGEPFPEQMINKTIQ